jgi:hypothetical protein
VRRQHADAERLVTWNTRPELGETGEQKTGVVRLMKIDLIPEAAEIADPRKVHA